MSPAIIIFLLIFALLAVLFFLKFRIVRAMHWLLQIAFPVLLILGLSALFLPQIYDSLADSSLRTVGVFTRVQELDHSISNVSNLPQNVWEQIQKLFNGQSNSQSNSNQPGYLETQLYPTFVSGVQLVYRAIVILLTTLGMCAIVYLSYTTSSLSEVAKLRAKYHELERRIAILETPGKNPSV